MRSKWQSKSRPGKAAATYDLACYIFIPYSLGIHRDSYSKEDFYNDLQVLIRFNVSNFTQRMGEPSKELFILDADDYRKIKAERVYHLNLVLTYESANKVSYRRFRIVLNRQKIKRIETVSVEDES